MSDIPHSPLRILHAVCSPVGGIIRHVLDLAKSQIEYGHHVGIIAGILTGNERADATLAEIAPHLKLGLYRLPIRREPHPIDIFPAIAHRRLVRQLKPDVLHAYGTKAGAFLRTKSASRTGICVYTPYDGFLRFPPRSLTSAFYVRLERLFMNRTDLFLFESTFARNTYERVVGKPNGNVRVIFNGVTAREFDPVVMAKDATDLLYIGQFRRTKGLDLLIDAVARLHSDGKPVTLTLAGNGDGEETKALKAQIKRLGLTEAIRFLGFDNPREAFTKGRILVVPSRGDSMPYEVIEAAAAGIPIIAANTGNIPEILGSNSSDLFVANSVGALADAIEIAVENVNDTRERANAIREHVFTHFSQKAMIDAILTAYRDTLNAR